MYGRRFQSEQKASIKEEVIVVVEATTRKKIRLVSNQNDGNCPQVDRRYLSTGSDCNKFLIPDYLPGKLNVTVAFMLHQIFKMFVNEIERLITHHWRKRVLILISSNEHRILYIFFYCIVFYSFSTSLRS